MEVEILTAQTKEDLLITQALEFLPNAVVIGDEKKYEGKPLAALFVARNGNRAYYLYGASTDEERNRMPTYLLQWEAMKWAKAHGCGEYDLWGVPDEDEATLEANFESRHDGLWGVYRFKRGFGGELKRAAQALDRVYNPLVYWAYLRFIGNRE